jgi:hypothetical protein
MKRKPLRRSGAVSSAKPPKPQVLTVWGANGVEVIGLLAGLPAARCSLGGEEPFFRGDAKLTRAMLQAAIEAVRRGALGEAAALKHEGPRGLRLPEVAKGLGNF